MLPKLLMTTHMKVSLNDWLNKLYYFPVSIYSNGFIFTPIVRLIW